MKQRMSRKYLLGLLACVLTAGSISVLPVQAGASSLVVDKSSFESTLDTSLWNNQDNDILIENGILVFPKESTSTTSLIVKASAKKNQYQSELVSAEATMNLSGIPADQTFALAMGLSSLESEMGEAGNVEIQFTNNGGLKAGVVAYDDEEEAITLADPVSVGSASNVKVKAVITSEQVLTVSLNGKQIANKTLPVSGEGRVGFLQTGSCEVQLTDVRIVTHEYNRPENCNVYEDFEKESINKNTLTSKMFTAATGYDPMRTLIEDMDGNRVFRFENSGASYLGSMYQYSNFELTFDVVYLLREPILNEEGDMLCPMSGNFCVSFGDEAADYASWGYLTSTDLLVFDKSSNVNSKNTGHKGSASEKGYPIYSPDCDKPFSVRVSMIDSVVTVGVKWIEEENFTEILKYQVSEKTPTGYVHIWTTSAPANFAIDNLSIVNKDQDPNLIEVDFASAKLVKPDDFDYQPLEYVYAPETDREETGFNKYLLIPIVAGACAVVLTATVVITKRRKKVDTDAEKEIQ